MNDNFYYRLLVVIAAMFSILCLIENVHAEPANTYVYVCNYNGNSITVFDPVSMAKVSDFIVDSNPNAIKLNPAGTTIYVTYASSPYVDVYRTADYTLLTRINIASGTKYMALSSDGMTLYVSCGNIVYAVNTASNTIITQRTFYNTGNSGGYDGPTHMLYHNGYLYVSLTNSTKTIDKVNPSSLADVTLYSNASFSVAPGEIVYNSFASRLIVALSNSSAYVVNPATDTITNILLTGSTTGSAIGVTVNNTGYIYRSVWGSSQVAVFTPGYAFLTNITGFSPFVYGIASNPYNNTLFVASGSDNKLYVLVNNVVFGYCQVGAQPGAVIIGSQATPASQYVSIHVNVGGFASISGATVSVATLAGQHLYTDITDNAGNAQFTIAPGTYNFTITDDGQSETKTISIIGGISLYTVSLQTMGDWWNIGGWFSGISDSITGFFGGENTIGHGYEDVTKGIRTFVTFGTLPGGQGFMAMNYTDLSQSTTNVEYSLYILNLTSYTWTLADTETFANSSHECNFTIAAVSNNTYFMQANITTQVYPFTYRNWQHHFEPEWNPGPGWDQWPTWGIAGFVLLVLCGISLAGSQRYELGIACLILVLVYLLDMLNFMSAIYVSHLQTFVFLTLGTIIVIVYAVAKYRTNKGI